MNKITLALAGLGFAAAAIPATANAAPWQNINQRQANLYQRIDQGVRSGTLDRREAAQVKTQFRGLLNLESRYRRGGLTNWERSDLNRRYDMLSQRVRFEKHDRRGHRR
ncbi:hypothetical protein [Sphingomonas hylomeconis]|uniref:DUF4148 domain-containing protein n=1 Tax=Sphingomonas hylomeconis TaxID=1395958 RepID=A0ABV7SZ58_9SPHN|nr:hypothetical protein [Sphingomonas hylomeconis]